MSNKFTMKEVAYGLEAGADGEILVWDSTAQLGMSNQSFATLVAARPVGRLATQQNASTGASMVSAGTSTAYTVALATARSANTAGDAVAFKPHTTNGTSPTLAVGGAAALPILVDGVVPSGSALVTTKIYYGITDGTSWDLR